MMSEPLQEHFRSLEKSLTGQLMTLFATSEEKLSVMETHLKGMHTMLQSWNVARQRTRQSTHVSNDTKVPEWCSSESCTMENEGRFAVGEVGTSVTRSRLTITPTAADSGHISNSTGAHSGHINPSTGDSSDPHDQRRRRLDECGHETPQWSSDLVRHAKTGLAVMPLSSMDYRKQLMGDFAEVGKDIPLQDLLSPEKYFADYEQARTRKDIEALEGAMGWRPAESSADSQRSIGSCYTDCWEGEQCRSRLKFAEKLVTKLSILLVMLNAMFIGLQLELTMKSSRVGEKPMHWLSTVDILFTLAFAAELCCRLTIERANFVFGRHKWWNIFDTVLVGTALLDVMERTTGTLVWLRTIRIFRAIRAARIIRTVRFVRDLRLMVASIICSVLSLLWAFVLLAFLIYLFAVFIMQGVADHMEEKGGEAFVNPEVLDHYGSLYDTFITLFSAISNGADWIELVKPLRQIHEFYLLLFLFYVMFVLFGVLNILTAVFVESAKHVAEVDRDLVIQDDIAHEDSVMNQIRRIFTTADQNHDGRLSKVEFEKQLNNKETIDRLRILGLNISEARGMFHLLEVGEDDMVGLDEFVNGVLRIKGNAKSVDVATLLYENKKILVRLTALMHLTTDLFTDHFAALGIHMSKKAEIQNGQLNNLEDGDKHSAIKCSL